MVVADSVLCCAELVTFLEQKEFNTPLHSTSPPLLASVAGHKYGTRLALVLVWVAKVRRTGYAQFARV